MPWVQARCTKQGLFPAWSLLRTSVAKATPVQVMWEQWVAVQVYSIPLEEYCEIGSRGNCLLR
jgi:hypothetical protein